MEALSLFLVLGLYVGIRLLLGHHKTPDMKDRARYAKGVQMVYQGEYQAAIDYFEKVLDKNSKSGLAWMYKAECHLRLEHYYQALANANKALDIDYHLRDCYLHKGIAFYKLGDIQEALTEFEKAVWHFREKHPETFRYRGICHYELGHFQKAEQDFEKAIQLGDEEANYYLLTLQQKRNVKKGQ